MTDRTSRALVSRTADGFEELVRVLDALDEPALGLGLESGWTVSAILAHLGFWDRWVETRWGLYEELGRFDALPDYILDLANAAAMPSWLAVPGRDALQIARAAATEVTVRIESLSDDAVRAAIDGNRPAMVDRTLHWRPHLDEINLAVKGAESVAQPDPPPARSG